MTADDYLHLLLSFLPNGELWDDLRRPGSGIYEILKAVAQEYARVDARAQDLRIELDPRYSVELLKDWEDFTGLPDPCSSGLVTTLQERQQAVVTKLTVKGGQTKQFYINLATALGYTITIVEYKPFVCGLSQCGVDQLMGGHDVRHHWRVRVTGPRVTNFRCGQSQVGIDPITKISKAEDLECRFKKMNQAHRNLHFTYEG